MRINRLDVVTALAIFGVAIFILGMIKYGWFL